MAVRTLPWSFPTSIFAAISAARSASLLRFLRSNSVVARSISVSAPNSASSNTAAMPYIDVREKGAIQDIMRTVNVKPGEPFILQPREFALAITEETLELDDDVLGRLEGRSSLGPHRHHRTRHGGTFRSGLAWKSDARAEQSRHHAGRAVSWHAHLLVHFRAALVARIRPLLQKGWQQVRRANISRWQAG